MFCYRKQISNLIAMPLNKKKSYQPLRSDKRTSTGKYTKLDSKTVSPSSSCSSTGSSKGLIKKSEVPSQVKTSSKLRKMLQRH